MLSPSAIAYQDAASFASTTETAPRWQTYFAAAPEQAAEPVSSLEAFDAARAGESAQSQGFIIAQAVLPESAIERSSAKRDRAPLPPSLAAKFAIAFPEGGRLDTLTGLGAYAEPSPEVLGSDHTHAEVAILAPADGATPASPVETVALTPLEPVASLQVAVLPTDPEHAGTIGLSEPQLQTAGLSLAFKGKDLDRAKKCLAEAIYFEARSEPEKGQYAVAQVVMNRTRTGFYPDSVCGVVYENKSRRNGCQFSFACDGKKDYVTDRKSWETAQRIADDVLVNGAYLPDIGTSTHYHATYVRPRWVRDMTDRHKLGTHVFYRVRSWSDEGV